MPISKYLNKKTKVDGITFASMKEARRYSQLKLIEKAGKIKDLKLQVVYILAPSVKINGRKRPPIRYLADFVYMERRDVFVGMTVPIGSIFESLEIVWVPVVEDTKGKKTAYYKLKRHLMKSIHGIDILET